MSFLAKILTDLKRSPLGLGVRNLLDLKPVYYRSIPAGSSCSDLFIWLGDEEWETVIDVMNVTSLCFPDLKVPERVRVILFREDGSFGCDESFEIAALVAKSVNVSQVAAKYGLGQRGTFVVLRQLAEGNPFAKLGTCLSERGYVGYIHKNSGLKQYVHGNSYVLYAAPGLNQARPYEYVRSNFIYDKIYRVQTPLNDCKLAVCHFSNPAQYPQKVRFFGYDAANKKVFESSAKIPSLGIHSVQAPDGVVRIEAISKVFMLRPVVEKRYESGVDFFHA